MNHKIRYPIWWVERWIPKSPGQLPGLSISISGPTSNYRINRTCFNFSTSLRVWSALFWNLSMASAIAHKKPKLNIANKIR
jgi:hypothetical protein